MKGTAGWVLIAVLGLVLAAGVGVTARELSSQEVGLSAEPITVGDELAPATTTPEQAENESRTGTRERTAPRQAPPVAQPPAVTREGESEPGDDNGGSGRGRGRGRGGGDDD